jgi:hypothetical protein
MAKYSLPETVSVALTDVGVGLGKAWFLTVTKNALETRGLVDGKDYAQFVLRTDGTRGERLKAWMANQIYLQGARGPMRHKGYELLRNILPSGSHLINGSKDLFHSRPDVVAVSVHAMAAPRRKGDVIWQSDLWEEPALFDGVSEVFVPTAKMWDKIVREKRHPKERLHVGGFLIHEFLLDDARFQDRIKRIQSGNPVNVLLALTGQSAASQVEMIRSDFGNLAHLGQERIDLTVFAGTNLKLAHEFAVRFIKAGNSRVRVVCDADRYAAVEKFTQCAQVADVLVRPTVETAALAAVMAHVNLLGTNPNTLANQIELEENGFAVAAAVVRRLGIAATLYDELETKRGVDLVENMLRARTGLNINGARELVNFLAKDRRVGDRIKVSPLV